MVGDVSVATVRPGLGEGQAEFADEAWGEAAGLDELQEHADRSAHVPGGHESGRGQLGQGVEIGFSETVAVSPGTPQFRLRLIRESIRICAGKMPRFRKFV